jgi:hypothetical protein
MTTRQIKKMEYPDLYNTPALAVVDHQIAHVYVDNDTTLKKAQECFKQCEGIARVWTPDKKSSDLLNHSRSGELILEAEPGAWFAYPWWRERKNAPDYAGHVDIHNKPGFDPAELFFGWPPLQVSQNANRIKGTHGRSGPGTEIAWASSFLDQDCASLTDLSKCVKGWLDSLVNS